MLKTKASPAPAQLVVMAQAINGILLPFIAAIIWRITADKKFMGEDANKPWLNVIFGIIFVLTCFLAFRVFKNLIGF
ncbi:MAG: divalent metal cation transporter [Oscillospiraceae bacterium]|nr:divalent metal cation transporter [Oscillospiraceae bacterium]